MLTPKQQRFVEEYLVDLNASAAARRAGYSARTAEQQGPRLLGNVQVQAAVAEQRKKLSDRTARTVEDVMADIRRRGRLAEEAGEFGPALKALELEGKHLGAFDERMRLMGPDGGPLQTVTRIEIVARQPAAGADDNGAG